MNQYRYDFRQFLKSGFTPGQAGQLVMPEVEADAAAATGQWWASTEERPMMPQRTDLDIAVADSLEAFTQKYMDKYGLSREDAAIEAQHDIRALQQSAIEIKPDDTVMTRNAVRDLVSGHFKTSLEEALDPFAPAIAASIDTRLEIPEAGIDIPNMDQEFAHLRAVAAGRTTEALARFQHMEKDAGIFDVLWQATWGISQQAWFGARSGEPFTEILRNRLWPSVNLGETEEEQEEKAFIPAAISLGFRKMSLLAYGLQPHIFFPMLFRPDKELDRYYEELLDETGQYLESDYMTERRLTGHLVTAYNQLGYGFDPLGPQLFGMGNVGKMLPPEGTPEREAVDEAARNYLNERVNTLGDSITNRLYQMGFKGRAMIADFVEDPVFLAGDLAPVAVSAGRRALATSTRARVTGALARHTGGVRDIGRAIEDAEAWVASADAKLSRYPRTVYDSDLTPSQVKGRNSARVEYAQAKENQLKMYALREQLAQGAQETIRVNNFPRANPVMVARMGRVWLEAPVAERVKSVETFLHNLGRTADMRVELLKRRLGALRPSDDPKYFRELLRQSEAEQKQVQQAIEWFQSKSEDALNRRLDQAFREAVVLDKPYAPDRIEVDDRVGRPADLPPRDPEGYRFITEEDRKRVRMELLAWKGQKALADPNYPMVPQTVANTVRQQETFHYLDAASKADPNIDPINPNTLPDHMANELEDIIQGKLAQKQAANEVEFKNRLDDLDMERRAEWAREHSSDDLVFNADLDDAGVSREAVLLEISRNVRRGVIEGAPEEQLMQWETTAELLRDGNLSPREAMHRMNLDPQSLLEVDILSARLSAIKRTPDTLVDIELIDDPVAKVNRVIAGPDQAESAGNAAMILAAGGEMDDALIRSMTTDTYFNATSQGVYGRLGMSDAPNVWLGEDAFKTNVEAARWQQSMWEKMSDFFAPGLYPQAYNWRPISFLLGPFREVGWALESINPRMMRRLENAMLAQEYEMHRLTAYFQAEFKAIGLYDEAGNVIEELAMHWGQLMNYPPESPQYIAAWNKLSAQEKRSLRRLRAGYDFMADKQGLRNTDRTLVGYISHTLDSPHSPGVLDPSLQGIPANEEIFSPWLLDRMRDQVDMPVDIVRATDRYIRGASQKLHIQPVLEELRAVQGAIQNEPGMRWAGSYISNLIDLMQGKPSQMGSVIENIFANREAWRRGMVVAEQALNREGRVPGVSDKLIEFDAGKDFLSPRAREKVHGTIYAASTLTYMGALAGNRRYFPMAIATGLATSGARFGWWGNVEGVVRLADPQLARAAELGGIRDHFSKLIDPHSGSDAARHIQKFSEVMSSVPLGTPSLQFTENTIRGWAFNAGFSEMMRLYGFKSIDEVAEANMLGSFISEAAHITQNINHRFGMFGRSPYFRRLTESGTTAATQFLMFPFKQAETLAWLYRENPGYIARYMAYAGALTRLGNANGIDLGQYVQVPGVTDIDTQSILTENFTTMLQIAAEVSKFFKGEGDPKRINELFLRAGEQAAMVIPLYTAVMSWERSRQQLVTGEDERPFGMIRELELGQFEWDDDRSVLENIADIPLGFITEDGQPSDMMSILTGLRSTNANLEKARWDALQNELKRKAFYRQRISEEFTYAINTGDSAEFERLLQTAIDEGVLPPDLNRIARRTVMTHALPRLLQLQVRKINEIVEELETLNMIHGQNW